MTEEVTLETEAVAEAFGDPSSTVRGSVDVGAALLEATTITVTALIELWVKRTNAWLQWPGEWQRN